MQIRQNAIRDLAEAIKECEIEKEKHREEAEKVLKNNRIWVENAFTEYKNASEIFASLLRNNSENEKSENEKSSHLERFLVAASVCWCDLNSDYQQDRAIPPWNK